MSVFSRVSLRRRVPAARRPPPGSRASHAGKTVSRLNFRNSNMGHYLFFPFAKRIVKSEITTSHVHLINSETFSSYNCT